MNIITTDFTVLYSLHTLNYRMNRYVGKKVTPGVSNYMEVLRLSELERKCFFCVFQMFPYAVHNS
jgi:hypothetical protein